MLGRDIAAVRQLFNIYSLSNIAWQLSICYPRFMARKTQRPKAAAEPRLRVITLGLPPDLIDELDEVAAEETRSRAQQAAVFLRQGIREWRQQQERKQASKAARMPVERMVA